jgi:putative DNA primase/helicase
MSTTAPAVRRATAQHPCPVCRGDHKCSITSDDLILCGRARGPVPGFTCLGPCEKDPQWTLFRAAAEPPPPPKPALAAAAEHFAANLTTERAADLAHRLGLPAHCIHALPLLGFDPRENCFTFPERDALGVVRGIVRRYADGTKRAVTGSQRGLSVPGAWVDEPGPLFLVEGPTDVLALAAAALCGLGRPSNRGGVPALAAMLQHVSTGRPIVVVGENDQKPDGQWPGREGPRPWPKGSPRS